MFLLRFALFVKYAERYENTRKGKQNRDEPPSDCFILLNHSYSEVVSSL